MIGFYDYTVILTYFSLLSAVTGIMVSLAGLGHPYLGCFFLLFSGLCDAFDGKVARTKANRTRREKEFGIQIDSLSDLAAFGVLPACIGAALLRTSPKVAMALEGCSAAWKLYAGQIGRHAVLCLYALAALIRLAYYNVLEQERQETENGDRASFLGLPVTSAALLFPAVMLLQYLTPTDITLAYIGVTVVVGLLFLMPIHVRKPGWRGVLLMVAVGAVEFALLLIWRRIIR